MLNDAQNWHTQCLLPTLKLHITLGWKILNFLVAGGPEVSDSVSGEISGHRGWRHVFLGIGDGISGYMLPSFGCFFFVGWSHEMFYKFV